MKLLRHPVNAYISVLVITIAGSLAALAIVRMADKTSAVLIDLSDMYGSTQIGVDL